MRPSRRERSPGFSALARGGGGPTGLSEAALERSRKGSHSRWAAGRRALYSRLMKRITGALAGLSGRMEVVIGEGGAHAYRFDWGLPD